MSTENTKEDVTTEEPKEEVATEEVTGNSVEDGIEHVVRAMLSFQDITSAEFLVKELETRIDRINHVVINAKDIATFCMNNFIECSSAEEANKIANEALIKFLDIMKNAAETNIASLNKIQAALNQQATIDAKTPSCGGCGTTCQGDGGCKNPEE